MITIKLSNGRSISYEVLREEDYQLILQKESWLRTPSVSRKFQKVLVNDKKEFLCFTGKHFIKICSEEEYYIISKSTVQLLRDDKNNRYHPFCILDKKDIENLFRLNEEYKLIKATDYEKVYEFTDKRVLSLDCDTEEGELHMSLEGYRLYTQLINGE